MTAFVLALLLQGDPRLAAKVDLRAKIAPLDEAVAELGRAAHLALATSPAVRELKATILVDGMPVGRVMNRLADAMRLQWKPEGGGYRLVVDPDAASREAAYLQAQRALARAAFDADVQGMMDAAGVSFGSLNDEAQALMAVRPTDRDYKASMARGRNLYAHGNLTDWTKGRLLRGLGPTGMRRLLAGEAVGASTDAGPAGIALPSDIGGYPTDPGGSVMNKASRVDVFLQVDPETWTMRFRLDRKFESGGGSMQRSGVNDVNAPLDERLADTPFGKEMALWDAETLAGPLASVRCDPKTPQRPSEWWSDRYSDADALEWLHDASGVPIVAMASRRSHGISKLAFDGTVGGYVKRWREGSGWPLFRAEDGFLMFRPGGFWARRRLEAPEAALRPLEAKPAPTIDDYAAFVARVTDRQAALAGDVDAMALRVCPYPIADGVPALRLWAVLTPGQRDALRQGGAVPYSALPASGRAAFETAAQDVFAGGWHEGAMAARFVGGRDAGGAVWSVFGKTDEVNASGRSRPRPRDERDHPWSMADNEPPVKGIELALVTSHDDSIRYTLPLAGLPKKR